MYCIIQLETFKQQIKNAILKLKIIKKETNIHHKNLKACF